MLKSDREHPAPAKATRPEVRELQPGEEQDWDRYVTAAPYGTFFHLHTWRDVIRESLGHQGYWLTARKDGLLSGIFPFTHVRSRFFGDCLVSSPLTVYGGICADDGESHQALLAAGQDLANRLGVQYLEMRDRWDVWPAQLPRKDLYVTFTLDLTPGPEKLLQKLPRDTRYAIRKSLKAGLEWTEDLALDEFYELYARSVHRLGTPVFAKSMFATMRAAFGKQCRIFGVRKNGTPIAGVMCFYFRDQVLPYYAGALDEYRSDSPNNFMYWSLIEQSCREGIKSFDFGRSKKGTGSFKFKSAWSMEVEELPYRYHLARAKAVPQLSPVDTKMQLPIEVWKRMPFSWTKLLGPMVVSRIPSI